MVKSVGQKSVKETTEQVAEPTQEKQKKAEEAQKAAEERAQKAEEAQKAAEEAAKAWQEKIKRDNITRVETARREAMVESHRKETTNVYLPYQMTNGSVQYTPVNLATLEEWADAVPGPNAQMVTLEYKEGGQTKTINVPADKVADYGKGKQFKTAQQVLNENKNDQVVTRSETKLMRNTCGGCSYFTERIGEIKGAHWETQLQWVTGPLGLVQRQQYVNVPKPATPEVTYTPTSAPRRTR